MLSRYFQCLWLVMFFCIVSVSQLRNLIIFFCVIMLWQYWKITCKHLKYLCTHNEFQRFFVFDKDCISDDFYVEFQYRFQMNSMFSDNAISKTMHFLIMIVKNFSDYDFYWEYIFLQIDFYETLQSYVSLYPAVQLLLKNL